MKNTIRLLSFLALFGCATVAVAAQEFGFGDTAREGGTQGASGSGPTGGALEAGDGFGFTADAPAVPAAGATVGGKLSFDVFQYFDDTANFLKSSTVGAAEGRLDFSASGAGVDALLRLRLSQSVLSSDPSRIIDEARLRLYAGDVNLEGGLLKVTWGRADSLRALDVTNPLDLSDLTVSDPLDRKIAVPMLRAVWYPSSGPVFDAVYIPFFTPDKIAFDGRWITSEVSALKERGRSVLFYGPDPAANGGRGTGLYANAVSQLFSSAFASAYAAEYPKAFNEAYQAAFAAAYAAAIAPYGSGPTPAQQAAVQAAVQTSLQAPDKQLQFHTAADAKATAAALKTADATVTAQDAAVKAQVNADIEARLPNLVSYPNTSTFEYSQAGLRITGTLGPVDLGAQYFFGFLPLPVISSSSTTLEALAANGYRVPVSYNRYHHVGADIAAVILGFNTRAEAAVNLTYDAEGRDPSVYNQSAVGSLGFDRELFSGISLFVEGKSTLRLAWDNITDPLDIEKGRDRTVSQVLVRLSQSLAKDTILWEAAVLYGIEDADFAAVPKLTFKVGEASLELSGRIFGGAKEGTLGQFHNRSFAGLKLSYEF